MFLKKSLDNLKSSSWLLGSKTALVGKKEHGLSHKDIDAFEFITFHNSVEFIICNSFFSYHAPLLLIFYLVSSKQCVSSSPSSLMLSECEYLKSFEMSLSVSVYVSFHLFLTNTLMMMWTRYWYLSLVVSSCLTSTLSISVVCTQHLFSLHE